LKYDSSDFRCVIANVIRGDFYRKGTGRNRGIKGERKIGWDDGGKESRL
jgi:hypothetical protein